MLKSLFGLLINTTSMVLKVGSVKHNHVIISFSLDNKGHNFLNQVTPAGPEAQISLTAADRLLIIPDT